MSQDKEQIKPYKPEEPVDETTRKRAAQKKASEELEDEEPISREQAEKEMREAIQRVKRDQKPKQ
ncbi:hypothetical protein [Ktedonobacter racemifer]|uniref:Uncharacterized protein n=1 Tax=Ktedonobacter racemifer DSM 44963 TaxID=485913 RepID=D6U512_KTERA|nr:hypothetical protein [Ktedonobacter racemifer]EFH81592.1 conserved hypothetical protein [Ktedonobacter racemifer DSM 44963]